MDAATSTGYGGNAIIDSGLNMSDIARSLLKHLTSTDVHIVSKTRDAITETRTDRLIDFRVWRSSDKYKARVLYRLGIPISEIAVCLALSECRIREIVHFYMSKAARRRVKLFRDFLRY